MQFNLALLVAKICIILYLACDDFPTVFLLSKKFFLSTREGAFFVHEKKKLKHCISVCVCVKLVKRLKGDKKKNIYIFHTFKTTRK